MAKGRRPTNAGATVSRSGSDTTKHPYANEDGGCARVESEGTRMNPSWGKDASFPQTRGRPEAPAPQGGEQGNRRHRGI